MSRYVKADMIGCPCGYCEEYKECQEEVDNAPSIDIVRCQDCKYWVYNFNGCSRNPCTEPWYATDFCSYGERKEK